jgi:hypothetical protein
MSTNIKVAPNEVDGWDVIREGEDVALTNVATRDEAERAAQLFAEHEEDAGEIEVERKPIQPGLGGEDRGVRTYFVGLVALLVAALILIVIAALVSAALKI